MKEFTGEAWEWVKHGKFRGIALLAIILMTGLGETMTERLLDAADQLDEPQRNPGTVARVVRFVGILVTWLVLIGGTAALVVQDFARALKAKKDGQDR